MAEHLRAARMSLVNALNKATISGLVDKLLDQKVFNDSEKEIIDSISVTKDKARELIDMVIKKGDNASSIFINALSVQDPELCRNVFSNLNF
ncbi:caspase-1-like [Rana temporaria]|uniref:caspase-1-like n=1 Tax=Rana temporaria TaxID=8407 RepID=UPI001AAC8656|nr:caspase-1-like [Rana temporaria]